MGRIIELTWLSVLISVVLFLGSCKKKSGCTDLTADNYTEDSNKDDGSCTYNTARIARAWLLNHYDNNGIDSTELFLAQKPNYSISFFSEKTYKETYTSQPGQQLTKNGIWEFAENYTFVKMTEKPSETIRNFTVSQLTDSTLSLSMQGLTFSFKAK